MSLEVYSRQSKAFQYDGYKINSEMREHIIMCTQCQGHLIFYFPNIWTLSFMEFQDSYNEFCRIKKFVQ